MVRSLRLPLCVGSALVTAGLTVAGVGCSQTSEEETAAAEVVSGPDLVISQIFAEGGSSDAAAPQDFVEIFNRGSQKISLKGYALQYAKGDAKFEAQSNVIALPDQSLAPGQHFLVSVGGATAPALTADLASPAASAFDLDGTAGKLALVRTEATLDGCGTADHACAPSGWTDFVGYGASAQAIGDAVPALTGKTAALRKNGGCAYSGNNKADFAAGAPEPRGLEAPFTPCLVAADGGPDATDGGASAVLLNEIGLRNGFAFAELACPPKAALTGVSLVGIVGSGPSQGVASVVVALGDVKCGANGLVLVKTAAGPASQSTDATVVVLDATDAAPPAAPTAFFVVASATPLVAGSDYDLTNGGTLALGPGATVLDGVAITMPVDGGAPASYAPAVLGALGGLTRTVGNRTVLSAGAWFGGALSGESLAYDPAKATANLPKAAVLTPGAPNYVAPSAADAGADAAPKKPKADAAAADEPEPERGGLQSSPKPPKSEPLAESAPSVCSMTSGPRSSGVGFLLVAASALLLGATRRRARP